MPQWRCLAVCVGRPRPADGYRAALRSITARSTALADVGRSDFFFFTQPRLTPWRTPPLVQEPHQDCTASAGPQSRCSDYLRQFEATSLRRDRPAPPAHRRTRSTRSRRSVPPRTVEVKSRRRMSVRGDPEAESVSGQKTRHLTCVSSAMTVMTELVTVEDVMTRRVTTARPEMSVQDAARLMVTNRVSGLPVVDGGGRVLGIISDGDLILRQKRRTVRPWWRSFFQNAERLAREYRKRAGLTVGGVMTRPAVVISPVYGIETAAAILDHRRIRGLPVVRDGKLVGVVSRGDLIKALAGSARPPEVEALMSEAKARRPR
jgi:CBS domain-containing protein